MSDLYVARRSMTYGPGNGFPVDRGQLVELMGLVNDEKLVRLGYVSHASKGIAIVQCGSCGAKFTTDEALATHGKYRHAPTPSSLAEEHRHEKRMEERLAREDEMAPFDLTKTAASRQDGVAAAEIDTRDPGNKAAAKRGVRKHTKRR